MKSIKLGKTVMAAAVGAVLAMGVASQAAAAPQFTIDPLAIPGTNPAIQSEFTATFISGISSELITNVGAGNPTATGWLQFTGFTDGAAAVGGLTSGLLGPGAVADAAGGYGLYLTYSVELTYVGGGAGPGTPNANYVIDELSFDLFVDPANDTTFTPADVTPTVPASFVDASGDDKRLGFSYAAAGMFVNGVAGFNNLGGVFLNSTSLFGICNGAGTALIGGTLVAPAPCVDDTGIKYFKAPVPFYELAFGEFNNTSTGLVCDFPSSVCAVTSASGGVDFGRVPVPEPASLALLGIGLAGLGFSTRRSKKQPAA